MSAKSVFDKLDLVEADLQDSMYNGVLSGIKEEVDSIDGGLENFEEVLDDIRDKFIDNEITLNEVNEFFDKAVQSLIEDIKRLRERLY